MVKGVNNFKFSNHQPQPHTQTIQLRHGKGPKKKK